MNHKTQNFYYQRLDMSTSFNICLFDGQFPTISQKHEKKNLILQYFTFGSTCIIKVAQSPYSQVIVHIVLVFFFGGGVVFVSRLMKIVFRKSMYCIFFIKKKWKLPIFKFTSKCQFYYIMYPLWHRSNNPFVYTRIIHDLNYLWNKFQHFF